MRVLKALFIAVPILALVSCADSITKIEKSKDPEYKLKKADEFYAKKKYKNAQTLYEALFPIYKGSQRFEELYYKYAYTVYYQKLYDQAESFFKGYLEVFPNSEKAEEIAYMRALSFFKQSPKPELEQVNTLKAINMMQTFMGTFPNSVHVKEAQKIIEEGRAKLERKDYGNAKLYYNLGHYRAAALAYSDLMTKYPETLSADIYMLEAIKAYYKFAEMSMLEKQEDRFQKVVEEYNDFSDRFPDSKLMKEAEDYKNLSLKRIKEIRNEQTASSTKR